MTKLKLPHQTNDLFITDGGLETVMVFQKEIDLPLFASFTLLGSENGRNALRDYFSDYFELADKHKITLLLDTPTWRANRDWCNKLGLKTKEIQALNLKCVSFMRNLQAQHAQTDSLISGCIGPRNDGYVVTERMTMEEAYEYHSEQVATLASADVDLITALTLNYPDEAIGIVKAAKECNMPVVISFTTETDGRLPDGSSLKDAIETVDKTTGGGPDYYMVNCAHPTHFETALLAGECWTKRIKGIRTNASCKSHAELDECEVLDDGDPVELAMQVKNIVDQHPSINILGGCCGTDIRHVSKMLA
ncbi:homocysteine S-methyltransferase family protein [Aliiglaciecola sp. M165]|uniref:homocysteine S-methyltransferase family protein n=1 Tax=Aliiglaciecola sp. M165 TaxID=2593649 RepID=UPI00117D5580|nr:homocysteine S-methyltransferase family protein [Aliiglaciecola sp. M165]TRY31399.1 homocysteine S-methyltransferase family protein [Aliiglaciecola sp. M165]